MKKLGNVQLGVRPIRQDHAFTCEAACLKMAAEYYDVLTDEDSIMEKFVYNPRVRDGIYWDNPYEQFVGFADGAVQGVDGWGVYAQPVVGASRMLGLDAMAVEQPELCDIVRELRLGHPVILWGSNGKARGDGWVTFERTVEEAIQSIDMIRYDERYITALQNEHVRLVVGFVGSFTSRSQMTFTPPTEFYVNDPATGTMEKVPCEVLWENMIGGRMFPAQFVSVRQKEDF